MESELDTYSVPSVPFLARKDDLQLYLINICISVL
jgi:hypothetical protein